MAAADLPDLNSSVEYLKQKKNLFLGAGAVIALVIVAVMFTSSQVQASRDRPWEALFADAPPWTLEIDQIEAIREDVKGTDAEPMALYWLMVKLYDSGETDRAIEKLEEFRSAFPDHYLAQRELPTLGELDEAMLSPLDRFSKTAARLDEWADRYPAPTENPAPSGNSVVLVTDRGEIEIQLHIDQSPESCAAFENTASTLKGTFLTKAMADRWVELGTDSAGSPIELEEAMDGFPPFEENNGLHHFAGSVSFRQRPFSTGPRYGDIRILLEDSFREDEQSTVFGKVTRGLEVLASISNEEADEARFSFLKTPVEITDVRISSGGGAENSPEDPGEEDSDASE